MAAPGQIDTGAPAGDHPASATTVIWGTNINAETLQTKVEAFLWSFKDGESGEDKYVSLIMRAHEEDVNVVNLDTADVRTHDRTLYKWLVAYPHEVLPIFDRQVWSVKVWGRPTTLHVLLSHAQHVLPAPPCRPCGSPPSMLSWPRTTPASRRSWWVPAQHAHCWV